MKRIWFSADNHISYSVPKSRMETEEEFLEAQIDILDQVVDLVGDDLYVNAGDLVDVGIPKATNKVTNTIIDHSPKNTVFISGNHELLGFGHSLDLAKEKGALGTLIRSSGLKYLSDDDTFEYGDYVIHPFNFKKGKNFEHREVDSSKTNIAVGHFLSYAEKLPHFISADNGWVAKDLVKEFSEFDFFVVGDNHTTFLVDDKYLSPGSLTRRTTHQIKHKPCIWCLEDGKFTQHFLKVKDAESCLTREHIDKDNARDLRMEEFAEKANNIIDHGVDIEAGVREYFLTMETRKNTESLLAGLIESVKMES